MTTSYPFSADQKRDLEMIYEDYLVERAPRSELLRRIDEFCAMPANAGVALELKNYIFRG